jgi:diguanylate cyclase (GGDEF)-like protein
MGLQFRKEPPRAPRSTNLSGQFLVFVGAEIISEIISIELLRPGALALATLVSRMWIGTTLKTLAVPGGILLAAMAVLAHSGWLTLAPQALSFLYYCALGGGMLLAWRFHSSRILFALLVLFLAQQATAGFGSAHAIAGTPGGTALQAVAVLVPLNFVVIAMMHERGLIISGTAPIGMFLFVQSVIVVVLCNTSEGASSLPVRGHHAATVSWPEYFWFALAAAGVFLLVRALITRKPADGALLWSLCAFSLSLYFLGNTLISTMYAATAAAILAVSIIETSYLLAYHDELTTLPSRRAFNDALLRLQDPYAAAVVDIDHFKRFNDTYGHDTGDQVLRLVAANLARVSGGGQAYRCGGEEFTILFPGKTVSEVVEHVERLREAIENTEFRLRNEDRRQVQRNPGQRGQKQSDHDQRGQDRRDKDPRDQDRRTQERRQPRVRKRARTGDAIRQLAQSKPAAALSVTVSIGVAGSTTEKPHPDAVLDAADKALYRAKNNGRNRVETAASVRRRSSAKTAGIA